MATGLVLTKMPTTSGAVYNGWTNPTNAYAIDTANATCAPGKNANASEDYGGYFSVGDIPSDATITKVEILVTGKSSSTSTYLTISWATRLGSTESSYTTLTRSTTETTYTTDITSARPGGGSWTPDDLTNLKAVIKAAKGATTKTYTAYLDCIQIRVTYDEAAPPDPNQFVENEASANDSYSTAQAVDISYTSIKGWCRTVEGDYYSTTVLAGQKLDLSMSMPAGVDWDINIFDSNGTTKLTSGASSNNPEVCSWTNTGATRTVYINPFVYSSSSGSTTPYVITITRTGGVSFDATRMFLAF